MTGDTLNPLSLLALLAALLVAAASWAVAVTVIRWRRERDEYEENR